MKRNEQRLHDLHLFAKQTHIDSVYGYWKTPRTGNRNKLTGVDMLIIDDIQRIAFNNQLLTASRRRDLLQIYKEREYSTRTRPNYVKRRR